MSLSVPAFQPVEIGDRGQKRPCSPPKKARVPVMAPSRTIGEQTVLDRTDEGRGSAMDFSTGNDIPVDDAAVATSGSKSVHAPRFAVKTDESRDALLTEFGKDTLK